MDENLFKSDPDQSRVHKWGLIVAFTIGVVLLIAAYGKFFYPLENLKVLDRWVSALEVFFIGVIFLFRKRVWLWLGTAAIFAAWCGYASFWCCLELPCNCMGALIDMPTALSISLDVLFLLLSFAMGRLLGAGRAQMFLAFLIACFMALAGYAFADWVYRSFVLGG